MFLSPAPLAEPAFAPLAAEAECPLPARSKRRPLRIALAGYGVVGQALAEQIAGSEDYEIAAILVRDPARPRRVRPPCLLDTDRGTFLAVPADLLVDVLSCEQTGAVLAAAALRRGRHVVSASKRMVSEGLVALREAAETHGARLLYSASVGGGAPVLETVAQARDGSEGVAEVAAVLNGTVNYILSRLAEGRDFAAALAEAQAAGFAEEDASSDLSGADAAAKLKLIAAEAFGADPRAVRVACEPLDEAAAARIAASGERWVQRASLTLRPDGPQGRVALVPAAEAGLPALPGVHNCARVTALCGRTFHCAGPGAGGDATAGSILADLARLRGPGYSAQAMDWSDFSVPLPEALHRFGTETMARIGGHPEAPLVVALGGISADRFVAGGRDGGPGWWPGLVGPGKAIDPARHRILGLDFAADESGKAAPSTAEQAEGLAAAIRLAGGRATVVGASYGGMVALALAERCPELVERLVVISAPAAPYAAATAGRELQRRVVALGLASGRGEDGLAIARGLAMTGYRTPEEFAQRFAGGLEGDDPLGVTAPGAYLRARGEAYRDVMSPGRFLSLSASLDRHAVDPERITAPVLAIGATSDQIVPPAQIKALAEALPNARLHLIDCLYGHDMFLKEGERVGALVRPFLEEA